MHQTGADALTDYKSVTLKLVDGTLIDGKVNILPHKRVSDYINREEGSFVIVVESQAVDRCEKTVFVNRSEVAWIEPND